MTTTATPAMRMPRLLGNLGSLGQRMFRSMTFLGKAAVIFTVFLLIVAQLSFLFIRGSNQVIGASQRELAGIAGVHGLAGLLDQAQALRRLALASDGQQTPAIARQLGQLGRALEDLAASQGTEPDIQEAFKFARGALAPLKTPAASGQEAFARADEFVQQLLRLTATLSDTSGLSQDPDPGSYHLMQASTQETLQAARLLGRLADLGADALAAGRLTPFQRNLLEGDSYVMYTHLEILFARYERVVKLQPDLGAVLAFEEAFKPVNGFMRSVRKGPLAAGGPAGDAAAYAASGRSALQAMADLTSRSHTALAELVEARIAARRLARNFQLGLVLAGLLVAGYFFRCFYLATRGGMQEVTRHIDAMAQGDLSTTPQPRGRDEAAALMHSIRAMQQSLRQLVGQVRECTGAIVTTSSLVAAGAEDLSGRTEKAACSLQETAAAMEEIATTVKHTAARADESATLGQDNAQVAARGGDVIAQVVATMKDIQQSSRKIGEITGVIDGIAFQTNILALNAAVEAARAGEQGRGFAVVAAEVRALAQRSAQAAREIKDLIAASGRQTENGARVVQDAGRTMGQLLSNAQSMSEMLAAVSVAAGQQTLAVDQVSIAVAQLDQDTQRNAALVEQTTAAALSMQRRAGELASTAARFTLAAG